MPVDSEHAGYSIRVAARLSGISADKLRVWERRYGFPRPKRANSGARLYTEEDVARLTLVGRALDLGYRPSEVVEHTTEQLQALLAQARKRDVVPSTGPPTPDELLAALKAEDPESLKLGLHRAAAALGPVAFVKDLASPLLEELAERVQRRELSMRHEHLLAPMLSSQLQLLLAAYGTDRQAPILLLTTMPGEHHVLGLEMAAVIGAARGATPLLMGPDTPIDQIAEATQALGARVVGLSLSSSVPLEINQHNLAELMDRLSPSVEVWLRGAQSLLIDTTRGQVRRVHSWLTFEAEIARLHGRR